MKNLSPNTTSSRETVPAADEGCVAPGTVHAAIATLGTAAPANAAAAPGAAKPAANLAAYLTEASPKDIAARYAALPARAAASDFGPFDNNLVVLDTETTGLTMDNDELMQIAAARVEGGRIVDWYVTFVNPGQFVPAEILRLTRISESDLIGAPSPEEAVTKLVEFVGDATLVAHNAAFDRGQITKHPEAAVLKESLWIDTLDLARIALPRLKSFRLTDLVHAFGTAASSHRADDDVAATCEVLRILLAGCDALPDEILSAVAGLASREQWPTSEVFRYFMRKHAEKREASALLSPSRVDNGAFSLRSLRKSRLKVMPARQPKVDAAADTTTLTFATDAEIIAAFAPGGLVGSLYPDYEARHEQLEMALAVNAAFARSENLAVEAGTGVGKSMAYLVPALLAAKKSNITCGVATKTNALLDQLVFHELPALAAGMEARGETPVTYAALKGLSHYPCLRKIDWLVNRGIRTAEGDGEIQTSAPGVAALISFVTQTDFDDADNLHFDPRLISRYDYTCGSSECLRRKCPYFGAGCFGHGARRAAENADVVVTNHALLFADVEADGSLLPPIRYWVVDEAHGAEEEAREAFAVEFRSEDLIRLADRCASEDGTKNLFKRLARREVRAAGFADKVITAAKPFRDAAAEYARTVKTLKKFVQSRQGNRGSYAEAVWLSEEIRNEVTFRGVAEAGARCISLAGPVIAAANECLTALDAMDAAIDLENEVGIFIFDMKDLVAAAEVVFGKTDPRYVYSAYIFQKNDKLSERLCAQIIDVGGHLNETFFQRTHSVVFTSATLTVGGSFDAFSRAMGLNANEYSQTRFKHLDSSFDFDGNMVIYVPTDIPEYNANQRGYLAKLQELLIGVHRATRGGMLTLFANRADMDTCYDVVQPVLDDDGLVLERQRQGSSVKALRDTFVNNRDASLFALKSFWAGFDAPGDTLRGVIIPKLPFIPPTDPLSRIREERDTNAWSHYVLSAAVIETRQAVGRLIRKADDRGIIILADSRILSKNYGRTVLRSMPSQTILRLTCEDIAKDIARRFPEWHQNR